jgi:hypothetical protein
MAGLVPAIFAAAVPVQMAGLDPMSIRISGLGDK